MMFCVYVRPFIHLSCVDRKGPAVIEPKESVSFQTTVTQTFSSAHCVLNHHQKGLSTHKNRPKIERKTPSAHTFVLNHHFDVC